MVVKWPDYTPAGKRSVKEIVEPASDPAAHDNIRDLADRCRVKLNEIYSRSDPNSYARRCIKMNAGNTHAHDPLHPNDDTSNFSTTYPYLEACITRLKAALTSLTQARSEMDHGGGPTASEL